jgi:superfamily I DNA/RNA helicase
VLWPAAVKGDADHKRRLLYNATTRAKSRCLVLVQSKDALTKPPFVAAPVALLNLTICQQIAQRADVGNHFGVKQDMA